MAGRATAYGAPGCAYQVALRRRCSERMLLRSRRDRARKDRRAISLRLWSLVPDDGRPAACCRGWQAVLIGTLDSVTRISPDPERDMPHTVRHAGTGFSVSWNIQCSSATPSSTPASLRRVAGASARSVITSSFPGGDGQGLTGDAQALIKSFITAERESRWRISTVARPRP